MAFEQPTSVPGPRPDDVDTAAPTGGPPAFAPPGTAEAAPHDQLIARGGVLVKGTPTSIAAGDLLLLTTIAWTSVTDPAFLVTVTGTTPERDPHGRRNTRVQLSGTDPIPASAKAADYRLLRATRTAHLASMPTGAAVIGPALLVLDAPARYLTAGDPLLVEGPNGMDVVRLEKYAEQVWYANAAAATPDLPPSSTTGIPLVVAKLTISARSDNHLGGAAPTRVTVRSGWTAAGTLLDTPVTTLAALPPTLTLAAPPPAAPGEKQAALVEDATGVGASVTVTPAEGSAAVSVTQSGPTAADRPLQAPLRILWDLIEVSRGVHRPRRAARHRRRGGRRAGLHPGQVTRHLPDRRAGPVRRRLVLHDRAHRRRPVLDRGAVPVRPRPRRGSVRDLRGRPGPHARADRRPVRPGGGCLPVPR